MGTVSPPIKTIVDSLTDKNCKILIPGCGNSHEAEYLLEKGFTNITVIDIAPSLVAHIKEKFKNNTNIQILLGDFFEHVGTYDLILEQTFFCALPPTMRQKYVWKMHQLLATNGILTGLLFNRTFEVSPPFGGSKTEYESLFNSSFEFLKLVTCPNSFSKRDNTELLFEFKKNAEIQVNLYQFEGITCSGCMNSVTGKMTELEGVLNVSMNSSFSELLIVSNNEVEIKQLQEIISYDEKYRVFKIND